MAIYSYHFPTRIDFGPGSVSLLPGALGEAGKKRPLIVTDRALAGLPPVLSVRADLEREGFAVAVFSGVWGNPVESQVARGVLAYRAHGADSILGLGGGAPLDVAKAIALMVEHPGELFDYEDEKPGARPIDREIPFWAAIPTTAGTGSEVGRSSVISEESTHIKKILFSPRLLAPRVFADPNLTLGLPPGPTAATGMDALTHLVEAYLARGFQPLCDGIALQGVRFIGQALARSVDYARRIEAGERALLDDDAHREARGLVLNAAIMGGVAFQKGLGVTHSLAHALSTVCDLHHGLANGIAIVAAMRFNQEVVEDRLADLGRMAGASQPGADGFIDWLLKLREGIGIPSSLREVGVTEKQLEPLVQVALADGCHANNPRPVGKSDLERLFRDALG